MHISAAAAAGARPHCDRGLRSSALALVALAVVALLGLVTFEQHAQAQPVLPSVEHALAAPVDSGLISNHGSHRKVVFSRVIDAGLGIPWIRLHVRAATLGHAPRGSPTIIRLTSLQDGATQHLDGATLAQWRRSSAYFSGHAVRLEIVADAAAGPSRVIVDRLTVGHQDGGGVASLCGADDRVPSSDPRIGRTVPAICSAWLLDDANRCFIMAGHCFAGTQPTTVHFNVPPSTPGGSVQFPPPADQYAIDTRSRQFSSGLPGDWAYFGCFPNSETGLTPFEAQRAAFSLAPTIPSTPGRVLRMTGFGSDTTPPTASFTEQTRLGVLSSYVDSAWSLRYTLDTTGGDSGAPVIDESTGLAIGLNTSGGCEFFGWNFGTAIVHPGLQAALRKPLGVCATPLPQDLDLDGDVDGLDLAMLLASWGPCKPRGTCPADFDGDGLVSGIDLALLLAAWSPST